MTILVTSACLKYNVVTFQRRFDNLRHDLMMTNIRRYFTQYSFRAMSIVRILNNQNKNTERDPVSETSCFFSSNYLETGRWTKSENPVILCVIHHRQNPIKSTV
jgi:hypothetical protein